MRAELSALDVAFIALTEAQAFITPRLNRRDALPSEIQEAARILDKITTAKVSVTARLEELHRNSTT